MDDVLKPDDVDPRFWRFVKEHAKVLALQVENERLRRELESER